MTQETYYFSEDNSFEYLGNEYDCEIAIELDKNLITQEAEMSHKNSFNELYDRNSLEPYQVRIEVDDNENPVFGMIVYTIKYKNENTKRTACGFYYPIYNNMLSSHHYQGSICW